MSESAAIYESHFLLNLGERSIMQQKAAESHSVISIRNSSQTALFSALGCSDSINNQTQNHVMSQLPVTSIVDDSMTSLAYRHLPNRLSMAANSSDTLSEPQMNNNQFVEGLENHGCNVSDLFKSSVNYGCEGLSASRWDFNKFLSPSQELLDRALARNGVHSIPWTQSSNLGQPPPNQFSSELSLSLSMSEPPRFMQGPSIQEQCSEMSSISSGQILHNRIVELDHTSCSNSSNKFNNPGGDCSRRLSPFMAGSKAFLQAMQEILAEIAFYAVENLEQMAYSSSSSSPCTMIDFAGGNGDSRFVVQGNRESEEKKKLLVALLQLVDDRYSQCIDEIHTVVSAFHAVTELDPNLHARFALPTISFMCKNLRERISSSILALGSSCHHSSSEDKSLFEASFIQKQWALQQLKKRDHQLWRPQRGLPERSVSVLRAWMFQNFLHPYPKDAEKHLLALKSGLTRSQVSNWFINARVRLWKPMIEEMYAEMNKRKAAGGEDNAEAAATALRNHMAICSSRWAGGL